METSTYLDFKIIFKTVKEALINNSTSYKRKKDLQSNSNVFVEPVSKSLGLRWDQNELNQYVSIKQSIQAMFQNESFKSLFFKSIKSHQCQPNILEKYCCAENYKKS